MSQSNLPCWIYKSPRKDEMYLCLAAEDGFGAVPPALIERFGTPRLVIRLDLHPDRSLALEDVASATANLQGQGHHLQLPPDLRPNLYVLD